MRLRPDDANQAKFAAKKARREAARAEGAAPAGAAAAPAGAAPADGQRRTRTRHSLFIHSGTVLLWSAFIYL